MLLSGATTCSVIHAGPWFRTSACARGLPELDREQWAERAFADYLRNPEGGFRHIGYPLTQTIGYKCRPCQDAQLNPHERGAGPCFAQEFVVVFTSSPPPPSKPGVDHIDHCE